MIVVTGASGRVGGQIAAELARRGVPFRAVTRTIGHAPDLGGAEIALAGYDQPDTLVDALAPGDRVFMVSMHEPPERRLPLHRAFLDVAIERGVGRIVYLSFLGADPNAAFLHARSHGATEAMLAESGIPYTAVRNGMYADEIATWFDADGRITGPGGDGKVSLTFRPELAEAIAELPEASREVFLAHEVEGLSFEEIAARTGLNVNTLLSRKHRAVLQLRRRLRAVRDELDSSQEETR